MRILFRAAACALIFFGLIFPTAAYSHKITAKIDISEQKMRVYVNGVPRHTWKVSTARKGYRTPVGTFAPTRMHRKYFSRKYNGSPMPHSVFFYKGYAIHGTDSIKRLGTPASHGCIRLHPSNASRLFSLIKKHGPANSRIMISR
ncbi:hypothetical protein E1162_13785 [Rhodobacteraceae bacterium RKSG542]|uniref:L,D-transpeptidase n=1 Tax=Pseudovibrio flavus TaxID=2529854 RepID=UPI0012BD1509|nr:L,D-transpeptidase [Pseudovibrio flavus]MTI18312.1 hypothetical protein [Pseudovibrio flavus]